MNNKTPALDYLNSFVNFEAHLNTLTSDQLNLERVRELLDLLDNPQVGLRVVHVAGTKGKGSTSAMIASIVNRAGYKVGLFTSPHFHRVHERIRVFDNTTSQSKDEFFGSISDDSLEQLISLLRPCVSRIINEGKFLTYFEVLTVLAIMHFAKSAVDLVVLETGLGGRLDATNVIDSHIAVLTPISLDHTAILGNTLKLIATEKSGIIKDSYQHVVTAPQEPEVIAVIDERCRQFGIVPKKVNSSDVYTGAINLKGEHQQMNAAVAIKVIAQLREQGFNIADAAIAQGLNHVLWPGRFEMISRKPLIIIDGAHNGASAQALTQTLVNEFPHRRFHLVLGVSSDKDMAAMAYYLSPLITDVILTKANHPRAHQFTQAEATKLFPGKPNFIIDSLASAMTKATQLVEESDVIIVTGSLFICAEIKEMFQQGKHVSI